MKCVFSAEVCEDTKEIRAHKKLFTRDFRKPKIKAYLYSDSYSIDIEYTILISFVEQSLFAVKKAIPDITHKMLITELRELERSRLILRKDYGQIPMKVEYSLTEKYSDIIPILDSLGSFVDDYAKENHILIQNDHKSTEE